MTTRLPRVLHACDFHLKYAAQLAHGTALAGCPVTLLTRTHDLEFGSVRGAMQSFVRSTTNGLVRHRSLHGRTRDVSALRSVLDLRAELSQWAPDVVHFQDGVTNDPRLLVTAAFPPFRYALTVHDARAHLGEEWSRAQRIARSALIRGAAVIFVHADSIQEELARRFNRLPPVEVVPHGVPAPHVAPLPERPGLLFFGRIATYYKGLDVLLDAMPRVWAHAPDTTLTIAGSGEIAPHAVLADPRVVVRNEHVSDEEVPELFARATCCVLPYREASQSGVGSQAKAYGRPIVASRVGGLSELVDDRSGRLVPPDDVPSLARALIEVITSPALAESMSRASVAFVAEAGWPRVAERTIAAYERTVLRSRS